MLPNVYQKLKNINIIRFCAIDYFISMIIVNYIVMLCSTFNCFNK